MKEEVKNLLKRYVTVNEIKVDECQMCIVYIEETMLSSSFFDALKEYYYTIWYCSFKECMAITLMKR